MLEFPYLKRFHDHTFTTRSVTCDILQCIGDFRLKEGFFLATNRKVSGFADGTQAREILKVRQAWSNVGENIAGETTAACHVGSLYCIKHTTDWSVITVTVGISLLESSIPVLY